MEDEFNVDDFVDLEADEDDLQEGEGSNFSSRKTSISHDKHDNRPSKKIKLGSTKGRPKQSFVWKYFTTIEEENICQISVPISDKNPDGKCNYKVTNGSTITNMIGHLRKVHDIISSTEQEKVNNFSLKNYNELNHYNIILIVINSLIV